LKEEEVTAYYDHWLSIILFFFQIRHPETVTEEEWFDKVERWQHLEKYGFLPVKMKNNG